MTYGHLQADCLYTGISSGPNARYRVWEAFTVRHLGLRSVGRGFKSFTNSSVLIRLTIVTVLVYVFYYVNVVSFFAFISSFCLFFWQINVFIFKGQSHRLKSTVTWSKMVTCQCEIEWELSSNHHEHCDACLLMVPLDTVILKDFFSLCLFSCPCLYICRLWTVLIKLI